MCEENIFLTFIDLYDSPRIVWRDIGNLQRLEVSDWCKITVGIMIDFMIAWEMEYSGIGEDSGVTEVIISIISCMSWVGSWLSQKSLSLCCQACSSGQSIGVRGFGVSVCCRMVCMGRNVLKVGLNGFWFCRVHAINCSCAGTIECIRTISESEHKIVYL